MANESKPLDPRILHIGGMLAVLVAGWLFYSCTGCNPRALTDPKACKECWGSGTQNVSCFRCAGRGYFGGDAAMRATAKAKLARLAGIAEVRDESHEIGKGDRTCCQVLEPSTGRAELLAVV